MTVARVRVLVVDDEPAMCRAIERVLVKDNYEVRSVNTGEAAVELLEREQFEILLADLRMPGMDGLTLVERVLALDPSLVAVVLTGYPALDTAVEAVKRGAYNYIPKPFTPNELRSVVQRACEHRKLQVEARELREARAEERARLLAVLESMHDGVVVVDQETRVVLYNQAATTLLAPGAAPGQPLDAVVRDPVLTRLAGAALAGRALAGGEEIRLEGRTYLAMASSVRDHERSWGAVLNARDVTPLYHLARLRANLVAAVSHELRSPLAAIEGYLDVILDRPDVDADCRRMLERCRTRARGLQRTIVSLLDISRLDDRRRERALIETGPALAAEVEAWRGAAERAGVKLEFFLSPGLPHVLANEADFSCLVGNLVDNAIKYNRPDGRVEVKVWPEPGYVVMVVEDTGMGIASEDLPHIFEEFYRVRNQDTALIDGSGLGLALVRKVAETYRCRLEVDSQPGLGTTFTVRWPVPG
ncbi:MAG: response regulator [Bacillota bacterium]